ncbi:MarR family transcriptional regulator [Salinisphaera hydrothermalis C41B8]|uniref:MarR family transcriptional regulator n=1 Tax=Salinisphaera hydrothermalis (strain C41B8) TaxID=1304275 RepID=A0A084IN53_SALHC|nr:MarR family transcriptional regulator [Salinisphaera hydrothermalis C41B8]
MLEPLGLTYVQYLVMLVLWEAAPRSVGELGQALYLDSGTLTPLLKRMEKAGMVTRQRDNNDERRVLIHLTEHGASLKSQARNIQDELLCRMELTREQSRELKVRVMTLIDKLEDH